MPNHIQNRVIFECGEEKLKEILTKIQSDDTEDKYEISGLGTIDIVDSLETKNESFMAIIIGMTGALPTGELSGMLTAFHTMITR